MRLIRCVAVAMFLLMLLPSLSMASMQDSTDASGRENTILVSELFISPNNLVSNETSQNVYGAMDWNADGEYGKYSDQFIEIWNSGTTPVDVSDWQLSVTSGSPPCQLAWNTSIPADGRISVFSADSGILLSYFDGDTVTISDDSGAAMDSMSFPAKDSWYGESYIEDNDGQLRKVSPTPGWGPEGAESNVALNIVKCYNIPDPVSNDAYLLKGRVVTMDGENNVLNQGNVMIRDGMISGVWSDAGTIPSGVDLTNVPIIETNGTIYPGLIDLHNHMHYNHIPLWDFEVHLNENQKSAEGGYTNRGQWGDNYDYGPSISWNKGNVQNNNRWGMATEQMKYAEVQAIAGGVTAVQGSPSGNDAWDSTLSRNVELYNFGQDNILTCAVCEWYKSSYNSDGKIADFNDGDLEAWFIHLSEGVDQTSRDEFDLLNSKGLLAQPTVVIHGTALTASQFGQMAAVGSNLVWSPLSNFLLYGNTTDVRAADNAGVKISLAPDWGPSGSKSSLHELKVADLWNTEVAEMVTSNPAAAAKWDPFVGKVKSGLVADLVIIDTFHDDPYRNLIESIDADVRLTLVQGKALFGDEDIMTALKGDDWEPIQGGGVSKVVDVTSTSVVDGSQSFASIEEGLSMAMRNELSDIREHWSEVSDMTTDEEVQAHLDKTFDGDYRDGVSHLKNMTLDPIFTTGDQRYFDVINRSSWANTHIDLSKLYDYYAVEMDADGDRTSAEITLTEDDGTTGGNSGSGNTGGNGGTGDGTGSTGGTDGTGDGTGNTGGTGTTDGNTDGTTIDLCEDGSTPPCITNPNSGSGDGSGDADEASSDTLKQNATFLLFGIIGVMGVGLYLISKTGGKDLNLSQEAQIEKIWDEADLEDSSGSNSFVPSPPPIDKKGSNNSGDEKAQDHNTTRSNRHTKHDGGDTEGSGEGDEKAQDHNTTRSNRHTKHDGGDTEGSGEGDEKAQDHNTTRSNRHTKHDGGDTGGEGKGGDGDKTAQDHNTTRSNRS
ncbi:amidohydrolase family protein [Candidatus Poseidoniales archaeon]|nr:amidohydrolase family protein [Candidatus Poseidoniales archaeon]